MQPLKANSICFHEDVQKIHKTKDSDVNLWFIKHVWSLLAHRVSLTSLVEKQKQEKDRQTDRHDWAECVETSWRCLREEFTAESWSSRCVTVVQDCSVLSQSSQRWPHRRHCRTATWLRWGGGLLSQTHRHTVLHWGRGLLSQTHRQTTLRWGGGLLSVSCLTCSELTVTFYFMSHLSFLCLYPTLTIFHALSVVFITLFRSTPPSRPN